jgi:hypothetical protein
MKHKDDILNELKAISPLLASIEKINTFTVPVGYFENLSTQLISFINANDRKIVQNNNKIPGNDVPAGYFDNLADEILSKIKNQQLDNAKEEIKSLSPILYPLQPINTFEVPIGYFDTVSDAILSKLQLQPAAKIISIRKYSRYFKYAVAAIFVGAIALATFKFTHNNTSTPLPQYVLDGEKIQNVDDALAKIDDADIVKYLQANGEDIDAILVANTTDDKDLPSEEDYLYNENALDNYLNNIDDDDTKN